ncbi:hypothetical protein ClosIBUN13A_CONTIG215g03350 [Clostridium sp. IBUN13A]|nr:hypothetical protein ClosIBUN22A_CONTIG55g01091 [Clostridium sp. IBUN22A]KJZ92496.1 hypothetical protein ClosIBUN13A_CONTIG215g03350 [Clostridium sp. IBUN13A]
MLILCALQGIVRVIFIKRRSYVLVMECLIFRGIYLVSINNIGKILKKIQKKLEKYSK